MSRKYLPKDESLVNLAEPEAPMDDQDLLKSENEESFKSLEDDSQIESLANR